MKTSLSNLAQVPIASSDTPAPERVPQWVILAELLRPQGRKGEILAELLTDFPERLDARKRVFLAPAGFSGAESAALAAEVAAWWLPVGRNQGRIVFQLSGIDSINAAEKLCGLEVIVPEGERLALEEDASYVSDLIGCTVFEISESGGSLSVGSVTDVQFAMTPDGNRRLEDAAPLLAVETAAGDEVLIPFAKAFLVSVDTARKRIEMTLPAGLLEVNRP